MTNSYLFVSEESVILSHDLQKQLGRFDLGHPRIYRFPIFHPPILSPLQVICP